MRSFALMLFTGLGVCAGGMPAHAAQCNFSKPVGSCSAQVTIENARGAKGSYSAEATVRSSAATCSKVEYYLDNTPHQTILKASNSEPESLFGTKPITKRSISSVRCTAYEDRERTTGQTGGAGSAVGVAGPAFFEGRWFGQVGMLMMKAGLTLTMQVKGTVVTGEGVASNGTGGFQIRNGRVSGDRVTFDYAQPADGATASVVITRKSGDTIGYAASASGITLSGTLKRQ